MFAGINIFWARLRLILAQAAGRGLNNLNSLNNHASMHLQVEWLLFIPQWKCTIAGYKNYEILPFEFSKVMEDMEGKFDEAYLWLLKSIVQLLNWQFDIIGQ